MQLFLSHSKTIKNNVVVPFSHILSLLEIPYWFDRADIDCGDGIFSNIYKGIEESSHCVAFIDSTFLHKEWPKKELELFHDMEEETRRTIIIPIYCEIQKEVVYRSIPWLEDRAFEKIEKIDDNVVDCNKIACRILGKLLTESNAEADISMMELLFSCNEVQSYYNLLYVMYRSQYYFSSDLRLCCTELCNILGLLYIIYRNFNLPTDDLMKSVCKTPAYIRSIAFATPEQLDNDYVLLLEKCINFILKKLLQFLNLI